MTVDHSTAREGSTADLVNKALGQMQTLVRDELALARVEMTEKGKRAGIGGGLLGGAGLLALYGLGLVIALAVVALDLVWPLWLAVLVVAVVVFVIAGIAALLGRNELKRIGPPLPSAAVAGVTEDVQTVKAAVQEGRNS